MEFTECLKNHQHRNEAQQEVTWVQKEKQKKRL